MSKMLRIPPPTSPLCSIAGCEHPYPAHRATRKRGSRADAGQGRSPAMVSPSPGCGRGGVFQKYGRQ
jgi:hypothetical protein